MEFEELLYLAKTTEYRQHWKEYAAYYLSSAESCAKTRLSDTIRVTEPQANSSKFLAGLLTASSFIFVAIEAGRVSKGKKQSHR
jgi:hypothetical protein